MLEVTTNDSSAIVPETSLVDTDTESPAWSFDLVDTRERFEVESFIRNGFESAYGCRLAQLMPELMVLRHGAKIAAACGLRSASADRLFLEVYLDEPIESVLSAAAHVALARTDVTEVGNLVIARPGYARSLITQLAAYLQARGDQWVVFSAVPALRNNFLRVGIPLVTLAPADAGRLNAQERASWGRYYDHLPLVTAVNVAAAYRVVCEPACIP